MAGSRKAGKAEGQVQFGPWGTTLKHPGGLFLGIGCTSAHGEGTSVKFTECWHIRTMRK